MEVMVNNELVTLQKKERKVNTEAPSMRALFFDGNSSVIGMMATKVQVFITLPFHNSLNSKLLDIIHKYNEKVFFYILSSKQQILLTDFSYSITDIKDISMKLGVYISDDLCAKGLFIINKEGVFEYIDVLKDLVSEFDLEKFEQELNDVINYKKKGHSHENWMKV